MSTHPASGSRSLISRLFAAALDGDQQAATTLRALADTTTAPEAEALEAARALHALDHRDLQVPGEWVDAEEQARVWATGYVDQLLARYRDVQPTTGQPRSWVKLASGCLMRLGWFR